jgi:hypothetical protein
VEAALRRSLIVPRQFAVAEFEERVKKLMQRVKKL